MEMKYTILESTRFESNYSGAEVIYDKMLNDYYVLHNLDVCNEIEINGMSYRAVYETGEYYSDMSCPSPALSLADSDVGTHELLKKLNGLYASDIENMDSESVAEFTELCSHLDTAYAVGWAYHFLNDNKPRISDYVDLENDKKIIKKYLEEEKMRDEQI
jgi:hypothetical protein